MSDFEKVFSVKVLGMIMGWGPWVCALKRSSSPRISSTLVFLRGSPSAWNAQAWLFSKISISVSHSLGQKSARSLLADSLYLKIWVPTWVSTTLLYSGFQHLSLESSSKEKFTICMRNTILFSTHSGMWEQSILHWGQGAWPLSLSQVLPGNRCVLMRTWT